MACFIKEPVVDARCASGGSGRWWQWRWWAVVGIVVVGGQTEGCKPISGLAQQRLWGAILRRSYSGDRSTAFRGIVFIVRSTKYKVLDLGTVLGTGSQEQKLGCRGNGGNFDNRLSCRFGVAPAETRGLKNGPGGGPGVIA